MNRLIIYLTIWLLTGPCITMTAQDSIPPVHQNSARKAVMKLSRHWKAESRIIRLRRIMKHWQKHS